MGKNTRNYIVQLPYLIGFKAETLESQLIQGSTANQCRMENRTQFSWHPEQEPHSTLHIYKYGHTDFVCVKQLTC